MTKFDHELRKKVSVGLGALGILLGILTAVPAAAGPREMIRAAPAGQPVTAPDGVSGAELVTFDAAVAPALLKLADGEALAVASWPVGPGERRDVELVRFDVYAPDARIVALEGTRLVELPRSRLAFFQGRVPDDPETRVLVSVDPDTGAFEGFAVSPERLLELRPWQGKSGQAGQHLVAPSEAFQPAGEEAMQWSCGRDELAAEAGWLPPPTATADGATVPAAITSLHTASIAVDTDNEFMSRKFSNNTTNATNYLAALIASMSVMYERDLLVRLVQGFTFLRVSTTADPYVQPCGAGVTDCSNTGAASVAQLNEVTNYWAGGCAGTCNGVSRAMVMMLSGKQSSTNSASGIAWIGGLCSTGTGYSVSQIFRSPASSAAADSKLVGHELGHNFGSDHTHCYSPPVDTCFAGEAGRGCYGGATSCPAPATYNGVPNVRGTVMSYCHLMGGCGSSEVFHPTTVALLAPIIQSRVGQCILPLNALFSDGFESGTTSSWQ